MAQSIKLTCNLFEIFLAVALLFLALKLMSAAVNMVTKTERATLRGGAWDGAAVTSRAACGTCNF